MLDRRVPVATLLLVSSLAISDGARAETLPLCAAPIFFLAPHAIGVDLPFGALASARLRIDAAEGGFEEIPVTFESSHESSCYSLREGSARVVPSVSLVPGSSYVLEVEVAGTDCEPTGKLHEYRFVARPALTLPSELPTPTAELLVRRCDPYPDYYFFRLARPLVPGAEGLEFRLSVNGDLHYCHERGIQGVGCKNGDSERFSLQWIAEIPHTGVRVAGPLANVELRCSQARQIPCSEYPDGSPAPATVNDVEEVAREEGTDVADAGITMMEDAPVGSAGGCQLTHRPTSGSTWWLAWLAGGLSLAWRPRRRAAAHRSPRPPTAPRPPPARQQSTSQAA